MPSRIPLLFGTATFGAAGHTAVRVTKTEDAQALLDVFFKHGYTEVDSARIYGDDTTEGVLSKVDLKGATIDTKIFPMNPGDHSPEKLRAAVDQSVQALRPHKIRTLYLHRPDRSVPFEDTLRTMNDLYKEGKFEVFGLSNFAAWEVVEVVDICKAHGWIQPTVYQGLYNAISRTIEAELIPAIRKFGLRLVTFNPLAGGFFSGKALVNSEGLDKSDPFHPDNGWLGPALRSRYLRNGQLEALKLLQEVADKNNLTLAEIGYRWIQHHSLLQPGDGVVFGASNVAHLEQNIANAEKGPLSKDIVAAVDLAQKIVGLDAPFYA